MTTDTDTDTDIEPETDRCERCDEQIPTTAQKCPKCGNHPAKSAKWSGVAIMVAGVILSLTVVGAVIGIPLFIVGLAVRYGAGTLKPTDHDFGGGD